MDTEFGEDLTSRFQVIVEQTEKPTDRQTDTKAGNYLNRLSFV